MKKNTKLAIGAGVGLALLGVGAYALSSKSAAAATSGGGGTPQPDLKVDPGTHTLGITTSLDAATLISQLTVLGFTIDPAGVSSTATGFTVVALAPAQLLLVSAQPQFTIDSVT